MSNYINADKIQEVIDWYEHKEIVSDTDLQSAFIDIMNLPSADVVEVVRCKDCKYYTTDNGGGCNKENGGLMFATETDFCSYGERKETE